MCIFSAENLIFLFVARRAIVSRALSCVLAPESTTPPVLHFLVLVVVVAVVNVVVYR